MASKPESKKAQMEIFGIVVIVILLVLGLLFVVRFSSTGSETENLAKQIRNKEIASNLIHAVLNSKSTCKGLDVEDLVKDCAEYPPGNGADGGCKAGGGSVVCTETGTTKCSCQAMKEVFDSIFVNTLTEWKIFYEFSVTKDGIPPLIPAPTPTVCKKGSDPAVFAIPTSQSPAVITLRICE